MDVSIYSLRDGGHQVSFLDPNLNRRVRAKFKYFKQAAAYKKKVLEEYRASAFVGRSSTTLGEFIPGYLEKYPRAPMFYRSPFVLESFIETFSKRPVGEISKMHLGQWLEKIQKERDYSARTMVLLKYCFNPFFTHLREIGVIAKNPMAQVRMSRYGHRKDERVYLAESEVREIMERLRLASPSEIYPISYFQLHTAAYIGEVVKLKWDQVNLEPGAVSFPATGNTSDRTLPLSPKLLEFLRSLPRIGDFVFTREDHQPWSVVSYYRRFAKVRIQIAFRRSFDSYAFRHTFAYHFLRKGGTLTQLRAILGHRSIDMTVFMYGSIADRKTEKTTPYDF